MLLNIKLHTTTLCPSRPCRDVFVKIMTISRLGKQEHKPRLNRIKYVILAQLVNVNHVGIILSNTQIQLLLVPMNKCYYR